MKKLKTFQIVVLIMWFLAVAPGAWAQAKAQDFGDEGQKFLDQG